MSALSGAESGLATRSDVCISPDPSRVITKLFVPGEEVPEFESRTAAWHIAKVCNGGNENPHNTFIGRGYFPECKE